MQVLLAAVLIDASPNPYSRATLSKAGHNFDHPLICAVLPVTRDLPPGKTRSVSRNRSLRRRSRQLACETVPAGATGPSVC
jgi:hypothetical protein